MSQPGGQPFRVIVGATEWTLNGVNVFSTNLVRGLRQQGMEAEVLLTEENSDLVTFGDAPMPRPDDIPMRALPVQRWTSWGGHWGAMLRYLEDRAPCVYIPNSDWRHSCVSPLLSHRVRIVGVVHSDDPLHYDHVRRLGPYWDAIIATSPVILRKTVAQDPGVAARSQVISIGVDIPPEPTLRTCRPGEPLRVIYPGTLKQHQKRVLDLPKIVEAAVRRNVPLTLTIAGGGPDEAALKSACQPLVDRGLIQFLGVVEHAVLLSLLEQHDVFIMTSEFEGMPNALLEAMGRGCIPIVTNIESGIPDLIQDGVSGRLVPVGDVEAFADGLLQLANGFEARQRMSRRAYDAVCSGKFRLGDMVDAYASLCERLIDGSVPRTFTRPRGVLNHPPAAVAGVGLFPVDLAFDVPGVGQFHRAQPDFRQFRDEIHRLKHPRQSVVAAAIEIPRAAGRNMRGVQVIVACPTRVETGIHEFSATLVRELVANGFDAHVLLTEEDTDLIAVNEPLVAFPPDVPIERLPVDRHAGWAAHWGAMIRYLEDRRPCVYIPNHDWRHSCVSPLLSDEVAIVGILHRNDALHEDHARRLGRYWNAIVTYDSSLAATLAADPEVAPRIMLLGWSGREVALDLLEVFDSALEQTQSGRYRRPAGVLRPPPRQIAGFEIFHDDLAFEITAPGSSAVATAPLSVSDYREFEAYLGGAAHAPTGAAALRGVEVIIGSPSWERGGVNRLLGTLAQELGAAGVSAHILLTEQETDLVASAGTSEDVPAGVRLEKLPVSRDDNWGAHWGALVRYLEDRAPCVYLPNHDWRHSCVCPLLSDSVAVVGILHGDDALYDDHVRRLGNYWNALVTYDTVALSRFAADPALASRVYLLRYAERDIAADYVWLFSRVMSEVRVGRFHRPRGALRPPPASIDGISIFPLPLGHEQEGIGAFPGPADYTQFIRYMSSRTLPKQIRSQTV